MEKITTPDVEKITIPNVGEIPMDHLSHFLRALVESVDLSRDLTKRFITAKSVMTDGLTTSNHTTRHSNLIEGCRNAFKQEIENLYQEAFQDVMSLVDSIRR